jgi:mRNA-degrading endonuclease toxin of MazEF toxin-antitoxin module
MIEVENTYLLSQYLCYILVERMELEDEKLRKQLKEFFYVKDFVGWAEDKVKIDMGMYEPKSVNPKQPKQKCIRKRTIWNTKRGINIGSESDGKGKYLRPALILRVMGKLCLAVPLTTKAKIKNTPTARYYHQLQSVSFPNIQSFIMLNQIKIIDQKRCIKEM